MLKIRKKSGELESFDLEKFKRSLQRSGAGIDDQEDILRHILEKAKDGISTRRIYQMAYSLLKKRSQKIAGRYRLKKAILDLGPTGYPFEILVCELLKNQGYNVQVGVNVQGNCIQHEVDVVAELNKNKIIIECKFHSDAGRKSDVKVPLYIHSRFLDIQRKWEKEPPDDTKFVGGWIITNTRFSDDAMHYAKCVGLHLISWDYPHRGSLKEKIDNSGLHPITALHSITKKEKQVLLEKKVILCKDIVHNPFLLADIGIQENKQKKVIKEARELISLSEIN